MVAGTTFRAVRPGASRDGKAAEQGQGAGQSGETERCGEGEACQSRNRRGNAGAGNG